MAFNDTNTIPTFMKIISCFDSRYGGEKRHILNPFNAQLNPICHLLALLGAHHILHVSRIRVKQIKGFIF